MCVFQWKTKFFKCFFKKLQFFVKAFRVAYNDSIAGYGDMWFYVLEINLQKF